MELPCNRDPASVMGMSFSNVKMLWAVWHCPGNAPAAQDSSGLLPCVYFPFLWLSKAATRDALPGVASLGVASPRTIFMALGSGCSGLLQRGWVVFVVPLLAFALLLPGCASQFTAPEPIRDDVLIHVHLVDHIDYQPGAEAFGLARCANGVCVLQVLRERYPFCLLHELRHAFEGNWHPGRETLDDC